MKTFAVAALAVLVFLSAGGSAGAQTAENDFQNFDNIAQLPALGWFMRNNSSPAGTTNWYQGNPGVFSSQAGASNSYIVADFRNTSGTGTISNWLLTPTYNLSSGSLVTFWTRTVVDNPFPDRLEVRLSTNGASTNVGTGANDVGDFTTLLLTINPNLTEDGYPEAWTQYNISVPAQPAGGGRIAFRYFVTGGGPTGDNSNYIGIDTFSINTGDPPPGGDTPLDYNGDGRTDYVVVRNTGGGSGGQVTWYVSDGTSYTQTSWGISTDQFVSGDFDGDDKSDITVYRAAANSVFYTLRSSNGTFMARQLGNVRDDPTVVGDYDGDDIDDYAVYRAGSFAGQQSFWYYFGSATPNAELRVFQWGNQGDYPIPGDFDGDGRNDFCIQRDNGNNEGVFYLNKSSGGMEAVFWGTPSDLVLPGDYDGDGKTDFGVVRGSGGQILWSVLGRNNYNIIHLGEAWGLTANDFPTQGDYDGDGKTDIAVWRPFTNASPGYFYVRKSTNGALIAVQWGQQGDYPVANFNGH